ncbi:hypothetical protein C5167_020890 [Papaver somniferum]|uniref:Uncharacterized protein n=1 Tax=Papaver somniferum TaxID=3469 RepID=A0A4Y7IUB9_PAPSO|nr:hypothetical protein C5167_020890 [Papaver somniferum]
MVGKFPIKTTVGGVILERKNKRTRGIRLGEIVRRRNTVIGVVPRSPRMDSEEARVEFVCNS